MTHVITQSCCVDAACVPVCPVDCIHPTADERDFDSVEMLYIDPSACVDCGACAETCPVQAVVPDHELTEQDRHFADFARAYYEESGSRRRRPVSIDAGAGDRHVDAMRVAIVGTGPSACYAALELLEVPGLRASITMIERLPAFGGLIRYGVAPDHQRTKRAGDVFQRKLDREGVHFLFNTEIGRDVTAAELKDHFDAVIYAIGAPLGRSLDIPGEGLANVFSSAEFVGWYNGHPDQSRLAPDLSGYRAAIVGNGNVALDVARLLLADEELLAASDVAAAPREALARSAVREVVMLGRRGPAETAATASELSALAGLAGIDVLVEALPEALQPTGRHGFAERLKLSLLTKLTEQPPRGKGRRLIFRYNHSPVAIEGTGRAEWLFLKRTGAPEEVTEPLDCDLVVTSIGYRSAGIEGVPMDDARGVMSNLNGRTKLPGIYSTGWIKRGPSGVIGSNRRCAAETVLQLVEDFRGGRLVRTESDLDAFDRLVASRQPERFGLDGWARVDRHERATSDRRQVRAKLASMAEMLAVAKSSKIGS